MVRKLILEKLDEIGLNMSEASVKIGRNHAYLQQFLKRGIPVELREKDRIRLAELLKVSEEELRGPSNPLPKRNYEKKMTVGKNLFEVVAKQEHNPALVDPRPAQILAGQELFGTSVDLPVFGTAQGGQEGALIVSESAVDWMGRPAPLLRVKDGYGIIVTGDSMAPQHMHGSVALVNPNLPPRVGDACVFRSHADDGTNLAMIKEYRGQTETLWKVHQHNPSKDFTLKKSEWQVVHRTVGNFFP